MDKQTAAKRRSILAAMAYAAEIEETLQTQNEKEEEKEEQRLFEPKPPPYSKPATSPPQTMKGSKKRQNSILARGANTLYNSIKRKGKGGKKKKKKKKKEQVETIENEEEELEMEAIDSDDESTIPSESFDLARIESLDDDLEDDMSAMSAPAFQNLNPWRAPVSRVFQCESDVDNEPEVFSWRNSVFHISQNRDGYKRHGQDCMGVAAAENWEVTVLADGHDVDGLEMSSGICYTLPHMLLRRIVGRFEAQRDDPVPDSFFLDAFEECEGAVSWTSESFDRGEPVKIINGDFKGEYGYIADCDLEEGEATVVIDTEKRGYNRFAISLEDVLRPRYQGGSTCVAFVRNTASNECRVAVLGDSRLMVLSSREGLFGDNDEDNLFGTAVLMDENDPKKAEMRPLAFFTPQHCVHNQYEIARLASSVEYEYKLDLVKGYLINPRTRFQIQPTRGFGDHPMYGTGYSKVPELSGTFTLPPNSIVLGASDGIFDGDIWEDDDEFCTYVHKLQSKGGDTREIANAVYTETMKRCLEQSSIDDISMFVLMTAAPEEVEDDELLRTVADPQVLKKSKSFQRKKATKGSIKRIRRNTIKRIKDARKSVSEGIRGIRRGSLRNSKRNILDPTE